jgi:hypothetical protein
MNGFTLLHHKGLEGVKEGQKILWTSCPSFFNSLPFVVPWKTFQLVNGARHVCPLYPLWVDSGELVRNHRMLDSFEECRYTCIGGSLLGSETFFFPLFFLGVVGGFFINESMFTLVPPLF